MKKLFSLLLVLSLSLVSCAGGTGSNSSSAPPTDGSAADDAFQFTQPITVVVPFKAGSATDNQIRLMQSDLEKALGTTLVIVNAEGGSGTIGTTEFLNSYKPDGYTILYTLATPVVYKPLSGDTSYTYDDLTSVARTSSQPMYLIMADSNPMSNAEDVIQYLKDNPGKFTYSHVGNGGNGHLAFASFLIGEGFQATSVPYPGGTADCYTATMGGEVDSCVYGEADLLTREGAHGVINLGSPSTVESLKDVPTLADLGYEGYETNNMAGFFYHKDTPASAVTAFEQAVKTVLTDEAFVTRATEAGFVPSFGTGTEMDEQSTRSIEVALPVIEAMG